jgi:hypothetical protein
MGVSTTIGLLFKVEAGQERFITNGLSSDRKMKNALLLFIREIKHDI